MKKLLIFSAIVSSISISCQKETSLATIPSTKISDVTLKSSQSTNANNATVFKVDLSGQAYDIDNLCTGSPLIILSGSGHVAAHQESKPWNFTFNMENMVVQAADGTTYRGGGTNTYQFPQDYLGTVPFELNNTAHFILTTAGGGNNISLAVVFKITVNAKGVFTVDFNKTTATCK